MINRILSITNNMYWQKQNSWTQLNINIWDTCPLDAHLNCFHHNQHTSITQQLNKHPFSLTIRIRDALPSKYVIFWSFNRQ